MRKIIQLILTGLFLVVATLAFSQDKPTSLNRFFNKSDKTDKLSQQQLLNKKANPNPKTIINLDWNGSNFDTSGKTDYWYNASGGDVLHLTSAYTGGFFIPYMKDTFIYNSSGKQTLQLKQVDMGAGWTNQYREVTNYNTREDIEEQLMQSWNNTAGAWETLFAQKYNYTYGSNNQPSEIINQYMVAPDTAYSYSYKEIYSYTNNEPSEVQFYGYNDSTSAWELQFRITNITWHIWNGNLHDPMATGAEVELWTGSNWVKGQRMTSTFNNNDQRLSEMWENWSGINYIPDWRDKYSYDSYGNLKTYFEEEYDFMATVWDTLSGENHVFTYNTNNSIATEVIQDYDMGGWVNMEKLLYIYSPNIGISKKTSQAALEVYPNPTADVLNLKLEVKNFTVTVTDLSGRILLQAQNEYRLKIAHLSRGIYLVNMKSEAGNATMKFMKN